MERQDWIRGTSPLRGRLVAGDTNSDFRETRKGGNRGKRSTKREWEASRSGGFFTSRQAGDLKCTGGPRCPTSKIVFDVLEVYSVKEDNANRNLKTDENGRAQDVQTNPGKLCQPPKTFPDLPRFPLLKRWKGWTGFNGSIVVACQTPLWQKTPLSISRSKDVTNRHPNGTKSPWKRATS